MTQQLLDFDRVHPADKPRLSFQQFKVLARLRIGPLTNVQAIHELRILRLSARVHELRKAGHRITSTRLHDGVWRFSLEQYG